MGSEKMKLKRFRFLMMVPFIFSAACTYKLHSQQYSVAVRTETTERASILRETVRGFAKSNGFQKETTAGNEDYLEKNGNFVLSFIAKDESYISLNNVSKKDCYSIGIYSAQGGAAAGNLGGNLVRSLKEQGLINDEKGVLSKCE
jgi:hypothetical protein